MNPSSNGWIHKFIHAFPREQLLANHNTTLKFYEKLKTTGFIYGVSISTILDQPVSKLKLTQEELTKLNVFHALLVSFFFKHPNANYKEAITSIISYYKSIERGKRKFLQKLNFVTSDAENLEMILSARLQESNKLLKTDAASLLTYALLYIDILGFEKYLSDPKQLKSYLIQFEKLLVETSIKALRSKKDKNKYDTLVINLVTSSSDFLDGSLPELNQSIYDEISLVEKQYVLDIACIAVWDDKELDDHELIFLKDLNKKLGFKEAHLTKCLTQLIEFSKINANKIVLFEYSHPVKHFYKQSSQTVRLLILRNKNRLSKELLESGELLLLLSKSTQRELTKQEKAKVKEQLFDIFKSIPSLAIFMLPGGAILLPLFVKLIPKLLPSAFNENRIDKED